MGVGGSGRKWEGVEGSRREWEGVGASRREWREWQSGGAARGYFRMTQCAIVCDVLHVVVAHSVVVPHFGTSCVARDGGDGGTASPERGDFLHHEFAALHQDKMKRFDVRRQVWGLPVGSGVVESEVGG